MTTTRKYIFLLTILIVATSFVHKDLNEYGKWLKFYDLKDEDFKQVGTERQEEMEWKSYDFTPEGKKLYENLYFYSSDSTYFLDLDSYNIILEKDSTGNLTWMGGDPEDKAELIRTKDLSATTLLFFGTNGYAETAIWRNRELFEIFGFRIKDNIFIPTIWKYDLFNKTCSEFQSVKTFKKRPESYLREIRLKTIKQK